MRGLRWYGLASGVLALSLAVACAPAAPSPSPAPKAPAKAAQPAAKAPAEAAQPPAKATDSARATWEVEWENTLGKARQEGSVVVSMAASAAGQFRTVVAAFERETGIRVVAEASRADAIAQRIIAERSAGRHDVDVIQSSPSAADALLIPQGALRPIRETFILAEVADPSYWYQGTSN